MITKRELQEHARLKGLSLGNAEKDYVIDIALLSISRNTKNELVFKGGTCLYKFYKLPRFSEDLDFSLLKEINLDNLLSRLLLDFQRFGIKASVHKQKTMATSILIQIRLEGPLFTGKPQTYATIGIDINLKSRVELTPEFLNYHSSYPDIAEISMLCMKQEETCAEKIRALITRTMARDLYDLNFLLKRNIHPNKEVIARKMEYYNKKFNLPSLIRKISSLEKAWKSELPAFTSEIPDFKQTAGEVIKKLKSLDI